MPAKTVTIDPVTRIEGHLKIQTEIEDNKVVSAKASADMFRGLEKALIGFDARVAQQVTQRVCGVCPYAHAEAASIALESAMNIQPNQNGQLLRNLIVGAYQLQDHLFHFYHLCSLDFVDITAVLKYQGRDSTLTYVRDWVKSELKNNRIFPATPFLPRYEGQYSSDQDLNLSAIKSYIDAFPIMADLHKMVAIFGGKAPHPVTIEAGGVTEKVTPSNIAKYRTLLKKVESFLLNNYQNDVVAVASSFPGYFKEGKGYGNLLSYPHFNNSDNQGDFLFSGGTTIDGVFENLDLTKVYEDHDYSYYKDNPSSGIRPLDQNKLTPITWDEFSSEQNKIDGKYSWARAPRYGGKVMEVGPVARLVNTYRSGENPLLNNLVEETNQRLGLSMDDYTSVMGRHLSRMLISKVLIEELKKSVEKLEANKPAFEEHAIPKNASGVGLTEATRGALAHWIETDSKGYIKNYEMIVPTTWNISPKDSKGRYGAVEKMLIGTKIEDPDNPLELARIVRSTDPCLACSVH